MPASPTSHGLHLALFSSDFSPTPQEMHSEEPSISDFVLAAQFVQLSLKVAPWCGFFFPAAHLLQSSERVTPFAEEYRPAMHLIHDTFIIPELASFGLYRPALQALQLSDLV
jgi:hypothetical protein